MKYAFNLSIVFMSFKITPKSVFSTSMVSLFVSICSTSSETMLNDL